MIVEATLTTTYCHGFMIWHQVLCQFLIMWLIIDLGDNVFTNTLKFQDAVVE
jgi:hypothetical protein